MNLDELYKKDIDIKKLDKTRFALIPIIVIIGIALIIIMLYMFLNSNYNGLIFMALLLIDLIIYPIVSSIYTKKYNSLYSELEKSILETIGIHDWKYTIKRDARVSVKSKQSVMNYTDIKFFKENEGYLKRAIETINNKENYSKKLKQFLNDSNYKGLSMYSSFEIKIMNNLRIAEYYYIVVNYTSPAGRSSSERVILVSKSRLNQLVEDKSLLMSKSEYNKYLKNQERELLDEKQLSYYGRVNRIIDFVNNNKNIIIVKNDIDELDKLVGALFDRTVNSIKRIKYINSEEWDLINKYIDSTELDVDDIVKKNKRIFDYYDSEGFMKLKRTCENLMNTQREFNDYIDEKVKSIATLFGTRIERDETINEDVYNYIHPYKKTINPFVAELSSNVFASAENNPLEYVVKYFYPDKSIYPEQIQKLHLLIEELETLKDAKLIIDNQKKDMQEYLVGVPSYVMRNDEEGFYSRLGFATIDENVLTIEYKFSYTSNGGNAKRFFTVPMTEETIVELIKMLESKLTMSAFTKSQRALMTSKLRLQIMKRDNYTCKKCGNSIHKEPNLLLEIDHITPISKGGVTIESNLQTLCWKCNRQKGSKLI